MFNALKFFNVLAEVAETTPEAPVVTSGWDKFVNAWNNFWYQVGQFWIGGGNATGVPYLATVLIAIVFLIVGFFAIKGINKLVRRLLKLGKKQFVNERTIKNFIASFVNVSLNILLVLCFLGILGVSLSGITTIFSSAILAIGLSLQDVIGNFASGLLILTSKPFIVGDYIELVGNAEASGTVVDVKFLATYLETPNKQIIIIPNKTITTSNIDNYSSNPTRRINLIIGVDYDSDIELVKNTLLSIARDEPRVLLDPSPKCYLAEIGEFSLNFSLRCYVSTNDYWDVLFEFNEILINKFREKNINIPFKTITLVDSEGKEASLKEVLNEKGID